MELFGYDLVSQGVKDTVLAVSRAIAHSAHFFPNEAPEYMSNHYHRLADKVGNAVLQGELTADEGYEQLALTYEQDCVIGRIPSSQWEAKTDTNRWDDMGTYFDGSV